MQSAQIHWQPIAAAFCVAVTLAFLFTPAVRRFAVAWGAMDQPEARKIHTVPVPRLGGLAVALAAGVGSLVALFMLPGLARQIPSGALFGIAAAAFLVALLGAIDDVRGVGTWTKLGVEVAAASVVVWLVGAPHSVGFGLAAEGTPVAAAGPFLSVLLIVTITNAVNMLDVADGVAAGTGLFSALGLGLAALSFQHGIAATVLFSLAGALAGFLPHNFRKAKIFLGDSGSLLLGFMLGAGAVAGLTRGGTWYLVPSVLALGLPLSEVALTVTRRALRALTVIRPLKRHSGFLFSWGRIGLFVPDRRHIPHRLVELGLSPRAALLSLWAVGASLATLSVMTAWWPRAGATPLLIAAAALLYAAPRWLYEELRLLDRGAFLPFLETRWLHNRFAHLIYDGGAIALSLVAAELLTGSAAWGGDLRALDVGVVVLSTLIAFRIAGLYRGTYRHASLADVARAVRAVVVGGIAGLVARLAFVGGPGIPAVWMLHLYFLITAVVGARVTFRVLEFIYVRNVPNGRRTIIVGADNAGYAALNEMLANPELGFQPTGFLDTEPHRVGTRFHGYPVYELSEAGVALGLSELLAHDVVVPHGALDVEGVTLLQAWSRTSGARWVRFGSTWGELGDPVRVASV